MWKDILKLDMDEARKLGERYAPEDMERARQDKLKTVLTKVRPAIEKTLEIYADDIADEDADRLRMSLVSMMRNLPMAPRMSRDNSKEAKSKNKKMVETYLANLESLYQEDKSPKKTTSLIDRARDMNRKHPRMGSGRK